jgi:3alpha(or 20beta)-hydroxysteroid dehydrogenase
MEEGLMGRLQGKVIVITGGARGQGATEGRLFAGQGADVVLTDVLVDAGQETAQRIGADFYEHDVSEEGAWENVVNRTVAKHGRIDVLVNNAGIFIGKRMVDTSIDEFERIMRINTRGVFLGMKAVEATMRVQGAGSIINISSVAGMVAASGAFAYGASKWAVRGMTKTAAIELARFGIRVNSIHPGLIQTDMLDDVMKDDEQRRDRMKQLVPLGSIAEPEDIANMALFLASDESRYATGTEFVVDGGWTAS